MSLSKKEQEIVLEKIARKEFERISQLRKDHHNLNNAYWDLLSIRDEENHPNGIIFCRDYELTSCWGHVDFLLKIMKDLKSGKLQYINNE